MNQKSSAAKISKSVGSWKQQKKIKKNIKEARNEGKEERRLVSQWKWLIGQDRTG